MPGTVQDVSKVDPKETVASIGVDDVTADMFDGNLAAMNAYIIARAALQIRERGLAWADPNNLYVSAKIETGDIRPRVYQFEVSGLALEPPMARRQRERLEMAETAKDNVMAREREMENRLTAKVRSLEGKNASLQASREADRVEHERHKGYLNRRLQSQRKTLFWCTGVIGLEIVWNVVDVLSHVL